MTHMRFHDELKKLHEVATPGPWRWEGGDLTYDGRYGTACVFPDEPALSMDAEGKLIAHLRNSVPKLLRLLEAVDEAVTEHGYGALGRALEALDELDEEV